VDLGEFGFAKLDDGYATGSSMLPQKKNPDIAELARGKSGRLIGNLTGLLATLKGLPLAYNRDLQEDKEPLFDSVEQVTLAVAALTGMIATATFVPEAMQAAADEETTAATDLAEYLVRAACRSARRTRSSARTSGRRSPGEGSLRDLVAADPRLGPDAAALVGPGVGVRMRTSRGAAGPEALPLQVESYRAMLARDRSGFGL
jgi:argininosuccinate lyase